MKDFILEKISLSSIKQILDIDDFKDIDWIWMNQEVFRDILLNLEIDKEFDEEAIGKFLKEIEFDIMIKALLKPFETDGYLQIDQYLFAKLEGGYKPTVDIETTIFVKEKYYRKLSIKMMNGYSWILKAMAMDTYFKMGTNYKSLKETYEELYEDNGRMIEDILSTKEYTFLTGLWKFIEETKELYFYKSGEFYNSWSEGEVYSKFNEYMK